MLSLKSRQNAKGPRRPGCNGPYCLRPASESSASGATFSRPFLRSLSLRPDDSLTILTDGFVNKFQSFGFPTLCYPSYEAPDSYLGGSSPTEHTSLYWTCTGTRCFSSSIQFTTTLILLGTSAAVGLLEGAAFFNIRKRLPSPLGTQVPIHISIFLFLLLMCDHGYRLQHSYRLNCIA